MKLPHILILIILLGSILRVYDIGEESFWVDESQTVFASGFNPTTIINNIYTNTSLTPGVFKEGGGEMPFYYFLVYYWTKVFGLSELKLRLLSAIFGIASIYMIFLLGKTVFSEKVGLIAAFILSINHQHIYYSQEARNYSLLVFLALISAYFMINALRTNKTSYWGLHSMACIVLIYTHYLSFLILISEYAFMFIFLRQHRDRIKGILISGFVIFLAYLPWIPVFLQQASNSDYDYAHLYKPTLYKLGYVFVQINSWVSPDFETRAALRDANFTQIPLSGAILIFAVLSITLIFSVMFLLGLLRNEKYELRRIFDYNNSFLLLWFFVPIVVPYIISSMIPSISIVGFVNYIMFATPPYYLLLSKGIYECRKYKLHIILAVTLLSAIPLCSYYANFDKEQWRDASSYLKANSSPNEIILINKPSSGVPFSYYYENKAAIMGINDIDETKAAISGKDSFWLVYSIEKLSDPTHQIKKYLDMEFKLDKQAEMTGIKMYHYRKK